jgi:uncharacterized protein YndB with AHSA1/START domain
VSFQVLTQSIHIAAEPQEVWDAILDPGAGDKWRNAHFTTDWHAGSWIEVVATIGEKRYRDKGRIVKIEPPSLLQYTATRMIGAGSYRRSRASTEFSSSIFEDKAGHKLCPPVGTFKKTMSMTSKL